VASMVYLVAGVFLAIFVVVLVFKKNPAIAESIRTLTSGLLSCFSGLGVVTFHYSVIM